MSNIPNRKYPKGETRPRLTGGSGLSMPEMGGSNLGRVLVIDDDDLITETLAEMAGRQGHGVRCVATLRAGIDMAAAWEADVVFLDVRMPDGNGLEALSKIREAPSAPEVIIITGYGDPDGAELAIKNGAWDYLEKPFSFHKVSLLLSRVQQYRDQKKTKKPPLAVKRERIVGRAPPMAACFDRLAQAADTMCNVLITGETGTGKELFASAIHDNSPRASERLVIVDCAALPDTLAESILFGHERGSFTGADRARTGLIKHADRGTMFLDEIGELPLMMQKTFLRVLETGRFRMLGSNRETWSDFRLVAATNRDLDQMVAAGEFRQDLLFRLRALVINLPPLREYPSDIKEMVGHHVEKICNRQGIVCKGFSPAFIEMLGGYTWPGNVRELIHVLETALAVAQQDLVLQPWHLPMQVRIQAARSSVKKTTANNGHNPDVNGPLPSEIPKWREFKLESERRYLTDLMAYSSWNVSMASRVAGLSRPRLYDLLQKHRLSRHS